MEPLPGTHVVQHDFLLLIYRVVFSRAFIKVSNLVTWYIAENSPPKVASWSVPFLSVHLALGIRMAF